ncbi:hypothetical protein ACJQWK_08820 [Exserohilum turcicum]
MAGMLVKTGLWPSKARQAAIQVKTVQAQSCLGHLRPTTSPDSSLGEALPRGSDGKTNRKGPSRLPWPNSWYAACPLSLPRYVCRVLIFDFFAKLQELGFTGLDKFADRYWDQTYNHLPALPRPGNKKRRRQQQQQQRQQPGRELPQGYSARHPDKGYRSSRSSSEDAYVRESEAAMHGPDGQDDYYYDDNDDDDYARGRGYYERVDYRAPGPGLRIPREQAEWAGPRNAQVAVRRLSSPPGIIWQKWKWLTKAGTCTCTASPDRLRSTAPGAAAKTVVVVAGALGAAGATRRTTGALAVALSCSAVGGETAPGGDAGRGIGGRAGWRAARPAKAPGTTRRRRLLGPLSEALAPERRQTTGARRDMAGRRNKRNTGGRASTETERVAETSPGAMGQATATMGGGTAEAAVNETG